MHTSCSILPPYFLDRLAESGDADLVDVAMRNQAAAAAVRAERTLRATLLATIGPAAVPAVAEPAAAAASIAVFSGGGLTLLPGTRARGLGDPPNADPAVNQAFDGAINTRDFYADVFHRTSVDDQGMELVSTVHYGHDIDNAFWNGEQMLYGDGSGRVFRVGSLTTAIDVIAHELTHGVTQFTANLAYHDQPGALNESFSDVFGSLVKQKLANETADQADWLIGTGLLVPTLGNALRSMKAPGTAGPYDPQPDRMSHYVVLPNDGEPKHDSGGVHINSGIPNRAFYLVATALGGHAWEAPGRIWYRALTEKLRAQASFAEAANATAEAADDLFGAGSPEHQAVIDAWTQVEVIGAAAPAPAPVA